MKKVLAVFLSAYFLICLEGCFSFFRPAGHLNANVKPQTSAFYSGPKAYIMLSDFEVTAAKATAEIGADLREALAMVMVNTNRFSMIERQTLKTLMQQQKLPSKFGIDQQYDQSNQDKVKTADLIIRGTIVEFEPQTSGGKAGIGGGGGMRSGILGGLLGLSLNKAQLALDIRIVDAKNPRNIIASARLKGQASDFSAINIGGSLGGVNLGKSLAVYTRTPMQKAIGLCLKETVQYITESIPPRYYKD